MINKKKRTSLLKLSPRKIQEGQNLQKKRGTKKRTLITFLKQNKEGSTFSY